MIDTDAARRLTSRIMRATPAFAGSAARADLVRLLWWTLFAAAFGYIEAAVVVYLRRVLGMPPAVDYPKALAAHRIPFNSGAFATMFRREELLHVEVCRELSTLLLLLGASCAAGRSLRERLALFGYSFAVWDLTYYLFLAVLIGFPRSLLATDVYFLVPVAWYGPVWFPVLVVMPAIIGFSLWMLAGRAEHAQA